MAEHNLKTLTVSELIQELKNFPDDTPVVISQPTGNYWSMTRAGAAGPGGDGHEKHVDPVRVHPVFLEIMEIL